MKGRKPIPSNIIALKGGRRHTHRPPRKDEPTPAVKCPPCPRHLDAVARKEWRRISKLLLAVRILSEMDRAILTAYCQSWSEYVTACEEVMDRKPVWIDTRGIPRLNPWLRVEREAFERLTKAAMELGLGPVSRTRAKAMPEKDTRGNAFEALG